MLRDVVQACDEGAKRQHARRLPHAAPLAELPALELPPDVPRKPPARRDNDHAGVGAGKAFKEVFA